VTKADAASAAPVARTAMAESSVKGEPALAHIELYYRDLVGVYHYAHQKRPNSDEYSDWKPLVAATDAETSEVYEAASTLSFFTTAPSRSVVAFTNVRGRVVWATHDETKFAFGNFREIDGDGGVVVGAPAPWLDAAGILHVYARAAGAKAQLAHTETTDSLLARFGAWTNADGRLSSSPVVAVLPSGRALAFALSWDGIVRYRETSFGQGHYDWQALEGVLLVAPPVVTVDRAGSVHLFGYAANARIVGNIRVTSDDSADGKWLGWSDLGTFF
jgi:hypothetical protein